MSKDFLSGLADESAGQVVKFIRFFNSKREVSNISDSSEVEKFSHGLVRVRTADVQPAFFHALDSMCFLCCLYFDNN